MKKITGAFLLLFVYQVAVSQLVYPYQDIKLEKPSDYKETESLARSAANFLLTTPFEETSESRGNALQFLTTWMTGNKEYTFYMQGKASAINTDRNLFSVFLAAMAKYTLENKSEAVNPIKVDLNAARLVLAYADDPKNNFKLKKKMRKELEKAD